MNLFFSTLTSDSYVLTETAIQTQYLLRLYADQQKNQDKKGWSNLNIMPLSSWLQKQWHHFLDVGFSLPLLLSEHQQNQLWQQCISMYHPDFVDVGSFVSPAKTAHSLAEKWNFISESQILSEQTQQWLLWRETYQSECEKKQVFDEIAWLKKIIYFVETIDEEKFQALFSIKTFFLYGFFEFSPLEKRFFDVLKKRGKQVKEIKINQDLCKVNDKKNICITQYVFTDEKEELNAMVAWAKKELDKNEEKKIACILPQLSTLRPVLSRLFYEEKYQENIFIQGQENFSNIPLIYSAMCLLKLSKMKLSIDEWSYLLRSPFLSGYEKEKEARENLVEIVYKKNEFYFSVSNVIKLSENCPDFKTKLSKIPLDKKIKSPMAWADFFSNLLIQFGWPGEFILNDEEKKILQSWEDLLVELSRVEILSPMLSLNEALKHLYRLVSHWHFQLTENKKACLHILSFSQACFLSFDAVWVMGLQASNLPLAPKPNPFLPIQWQKQHSLPHASYEWEKYYSDYLFSSFISSGKEIFLSYSKQNEVGELEPSSLLDTISKETVKTNLINDKKNEVVLFEYYSDDVGPFLKEKKIEGGSKLFQEQSRCAFRGFSLSRLKTKKLNSVEYGLTPREKGILIHSALEHFWKSVKTQAALKVFSQEKLVEKINETIDSAILNLLRERPSLHHSIFLDLEKKRLEKVLLRWLSLEIVRQPFDVMFIEKSFEITFSELKCVLRVDRIDHVNEQGYYIIDYKTSLVSSQDWLGERPEEPQLPLYALTSDMLINGLLFAQIRADKMGFKGIVLENEKSLKQLSKEAWLNQLTSWKNVLNELARQIKTGVAVLNPREGFKTCETCDLAMLCRTYDCVVNEGENDFE